MNRRELLWFYDQKTVLSFILWPYSRSLNVDEATQAHNIGYRNILPIHHKRRACGDCAYQQPTRGCIEVILCAHPDHQKYSGKKPRSVDTKKFNSTGLCPGFKEEIK